jgi:DNA-binding response OmpR family regulator
MVVDDDTDIVQILRFYLNRAGFRVVSATNVAEALDQLVACRPDLITLDISLSDEPDAGYALCQMIRAGGQDDALRPFANLPILMLTGRSSADDKARGFAAGATDYLTKPVQRDVFIHRIQQLLHGGLMNERSL